MKDYGPEEFILSDGTEIILKSWDPHQSTELSKAIIQFTHETDHSLKNEDTYSVLEEIKTRWESTAVSPEGLFLSAFTKDKLIAFLTLRKPFQDRPWAKHVGEFNMLILDRYWSLGLGSKFIEILEKIATNHGIHRLEAKVRIKNQRAWNFYIRHNYQIEGKRKQAAFIDGHYEDEYFIAKILH